jgi:hypothetical protein
MNIEIRRMNSITILTVLLALALAITSYCGAFISGTYERDAVSMAAQGIGQDIFDLFLMVPLLLILLLFMRQGNRLASFLFSGTVFYVLYSFLIYCFGVHFNNLFLVYCLIAGLSFYTFALGVNQLRIIITPEWFNNKVPVRMVGIYLIIIALAFYFLWLKDIVPAIIANTVPKSVGDYQLLVNPVHVLDISFVLPGLIITAFLLIAKKTSGLLFAPVFLVFIILQGLAMISMAIVLNAKGISESLDIVWIFIIIAVLSSIILSLFFLRIRKRT